MEASAPKVIRDADRGDEPSQSGAAPGRDDLSRLVREANAGGLSFQQMADRGIDPESGERASKSYFQKLSTNSVPNPPTPERINAIALALHVPGALVKRAAAAQWLDYQATELSGYDDDVRVIVAHLAGMRKSELKRWRAMIEASERARGEEG